jgi:hypothetical protein
VGIVSHFWVLAYFFLPALDSVGKLSPPGRISQRLAR